MKILLLAIIFIFTACSNKPMVVKEYITEYKTIVVPTICDVEIRDRPVITDTVKLKELILSILVYTELLETDIKYCNGSSNRTIDEVIHEKE